MRISADRAHEWFSEAFRFAIVYLNGERIDRCVTASEKEGFVLVETGRLSLEQSQLIYERRIGRVTVCLPEDKKFLLGPQNEE